MVISVQFKDRNKVFRGKTYDYVLAADEKTPKTGDIIRMMDEECDYVANGTRVKVTGIRKKTTADIARLQTIRFIYASMD